ncbi:NAD(P)/FAD-dependent oxidoreductase [Streptomyces kanamyceticus]|uniref:NAD(P)/FAD-dependent oxidoreductase n=1 Tax=Streptomyces kanamyceticus TaxID=1967 RepID=A0A5J6GPE3_STRKN|nr:NAD(P)/FAD-dependent oxidoreductase [Streptomyces kanamyceticus]QEU97840.1 NAD(P)/FAD-dependent oxidoreductase [Streptomyces kanamyceticus]
MTRKNSSQDNAYEVVVVGGGAAGLSAALVLGRSRRRVLVVDAGEPRNAPAAHMQGYLSRDGMPPAEFLAVSRGELAQYGVDVVRDRVTAVAPDGAGAFTLSLADGAPVHARRVIVATGLVDELPELPGLAERWGHDVLHCPYCHGWEVRDEAFGVLASEPFSSHQALLVTQWSKDVTLFLHTVRDVPDADWERLAAAGVSVVEGEVAGLEVEDDRLTGVRLADGRVVARSVLFVAARPVPRSGLLTALGADTKDTPYGPYPATDELGRTSVPGVWAVGNTASAMEQVINAAAMGYRAGLTINAELLMEDIDATAERRRAGVFTAEAEAAVSRAVTGERAHGLPV